MRRAMGTIFSAVGCSLLAAHLVGQEAAPAEQKNPKEGFPRQTYSIARATSSVTVDAVLDEEAWRAVTPLVLAWETFPGNNIEAPVRSEVMLVYDEKNLYLAFKAWDPKPAEIRAHLSDRDKAFSDDFIGVVFDPFNDERRGFEFFVNPLGVQMDLSNNDVGGFEDETWDTLWSSAGRITPDGYVVEIAIPFGSLRFPKSAGVQTWGLDLVRIYPRSQRHRIGLSRLSRDKDCYICQHAKLTGFEGITPGRNIELDPTVTAQRNDTREAFPAGKVSTGGVKFDPGLSGRWGVTPNLTLNGAVNPDFSQVEADSAQLDINTQFTLFFNEKRPFFLEGADFFQTPLSIVYTRTVSDPIWGVKLTGKEGKNAVGFFSSRDSITNLVIPGSQGSSSASIDRENVSSVVRYRYDVGKNSTVGLLLADRSAGEYGNRVGGIDGYFRITPRDTIQAQILRSSTEYPASLAASFGQPEGRLGDDAIRLHYTHSTKNWFWRATAEDIGEEFRADSGFMPQVDYRKAIVGLEHTWWGEKGDWYNRWFVGGDWDRTETQAGQLLEEEFESYIGLAGPLQSYFFVDAGARDKFFNGRNFDQMFLNVFFEVRPSGALYLNLDASYGDEIDFANTRAGTQLRLTPFVRYELGRHLRLELEHTYRGLDVAGGRLFDANLTQLRVVHQFNVQVFVRAILQYTDISRDTTLYTFQTDSRTRQLFPQLLFSYKLNPQTVFFAGYTENRFGDDSIDLTQRDRTLFMKVGYAWVM